MCVILEPVELLWHEDAYRDTAVLGDRIQCILGSVPSTLSL